MTMPRQCNDDKNNDTFWSMKKAQFSVAWERSLIHASLDGAAIVTPFPINFSFLFYFYFQNESVTSRHIKNVEHYLWRLFGNFLRCWEWNTINEIAVARISVSSPFVFNRAWQQISTLNNTRGCFMRYT